MAENTEDESPAGEWNQITELLRQVAEAYGRSSQLTKQLEQYDLCAMNVRAFCRVHNIPFTDHYEPPVWDEDDEEDDEEDDWWSEWDDEDDDGE